MLHMGGNQSTQKVNLHEQRTCKLYRKDEGQDWNQGLCRCEVPMLSTKEVLLYVKQKQLAWNTYKYCCINILSNLKVVFRLLHFIKCNNKNLI